MSDLKAKERHARWRAANRARVNAQAMARYKADPAAWKARSEKWKAKNRDRELAKGRATAKVRYDANPEKYRALARADYAKNKQARREKNVKWFETNPKAKRVYESTRRARKRNAGGEYSPSDIERIYAMQRETCPVCRLALDGEFEIDHIMPLSLGGSNGPENLQLLHEVCNRSKHAKHPVDFMQTKGFLL